MTPGSIPSLHGRRFRALSQSSGGEVGDGTVFTYHEVAGEIWAEYSGGTIRRGYLIGVRNGDQLTFRYAHLNADGDTSSGRCATQICATENGRLQLHETWAWESRPGTGTSILEELQEQSSGATTAMRRTLTHKHHSTACVRARDPTHAVLIHCANPPAADPVSYGLTHSLQPNAGSGRAAGSHPA